MYWNPTPLPPSLSFPLPPSLLCLFQTLIINEAKQDGFLLHFFNQVPVINVNQIVTFLVFANYRTSGVSKVTRRCFSFLCSWLDDLFRQYICHLMLSQSVYREITEWSYDQRALFLVKKRLKTRRLLHGLYLSIYSSDRKYMFSVKQKLVLIIA